ncbi:metallophosphoesterase [Serratia sp. (in: enterobacteria)]|uniref:metallophosphoesterase family protein n=1 Tax=Serratia sp. (in: enterobacteria) TaxID=616 RepID=UPI003988AF09
MAKLVIFLVIAAILLASTITSQNVLALSKMEKQVKKFIRAETSGGSKLSDLCTVTLQIKDKENVSKTFRDICEEKQQPDDNQTIPPTDNQTIPPIDNGTVIPPVDNQTGNPPECNTGEFWNGTGCETNPPLPTCDTGEFYNTTSQLCEQLPTTEPGNDTHTPPTPVSQVKIIGVGDVECEGDGIKVLNQIKKQNPTLVLNLGDLCYDSTSSKYISTWGSLGNLLACQIGNHDSEEDGSASLYRDFLAYCGNDYTIKRGNVLAVGLNTNDNSAGMKLQSQNVVARLSNSTYMNDVDIVIIASHKPICQTPPNSHHPVTEDSAAKAVKTAFCEPIKQAVGPTAKLIFLNGHNHIMAKGVQDGITYIESGAGGRNHYECGTNAVFTFCNNTKYGFWELVSKSDGTATMKFKDVNGGVVN